MTQSCDSSIESNKYFSTVKQHYLPILDIHPANVFHGILTQNDELLSVLEDIKLMADSDLPVMILGETGTGKELIANAIHKESLRRNNSIVPINVGSIAADIQESELFGHEKGSFTGAINHRTGLIEQANKGTLFLDEVGDMTPALQVALLRVLGEQEYRVVGGVDTRQVDVRVVSATNRDVYQQIKDRVFREDLFYRLSAWSIRLPALRDRDGDLPILIYYFINSFMKKYNCNISGIHQESMAKLATYQWPGNIRELRSCLERAVVMARPKGLIELNHINFEHGITELFANRREFNNAEMLSTCLETYEYQEALTIVDRMVVTRILEECGFNISLASRRLGIGRNLLYRKIEDYGLNAISC